MTEGIYTHLDWLSSQRIHRPRSSHLELIIDHMSQPLIIDHSDIYIRHELFAGDSRVHRFISVIVISGR